MHEIAHGAAAALLGDPTAKSSGRLSLNPIRHIDPFGTVLMPLLLAISGLPVFAYAKPVPYNPRYFKNVRVGEAIVGLAGPSANLVLALIGAGIAWLLLPLTDSYFMEDSLSSWIAAIAYYAFLPQFILINLYLMFFNLIPIPPLDGSSLISLVLSDKALMTYYRIQQYALPILMVAIIILPNVIHVNPIGLYLDITAGNLAQLIMPPALWW